MRPRLMFLLTKLTCWKTRPTYKSISMLRMNDCLLLRTAKPNKSLDRSHRQRASHQSDPVLSWLVLAGGGPVNSAVRRYFSLLPMVISELTDRSKDIFSVFRTAADRWFSFLITDFGFRLEFTKIDESMAFADMLTCELHYRNATTEIEVDYTWYKDLRGSPVVMVGQLQTTNDRSEEH